MVAAELMDLRRGFSNYLEAKKKAEAEGTALTPLWKILEVGPYIFIYYVFRSWLCECERYPSQ